MKLIYISGPYRDSRGEWYVKQNIRRAESAAEFVWQAGAVAICPHLNTAFFGGLPGCGNDKIWLQGDLEIVRRCDAVFAIDRWQDSAGAKVEIELAESLGLPILVTHEQVKDYIYLFGGDKN